MEGLIFEGAYVRREKCVLKSIGLALFLEGNLPFSSFYFVFEGNFQVQAPPGGGVLYLEGRFNGRFSALRVWGAYIWRGLCMDGLIFRILRYIFEIVFGFTSSFWRAQVRGILALIFYYHLFFLLLRFIINELSLRLIKVQKNI